MVRAAGENRIVLHRMLFEISILALLHRLGAALAPKTVDHRSASRSGPISAHRALSVCSGGPQREAPSMKTALYGIAAALAAFLAPAAHAAEIKIIASNAVREPYRELIPVFEKATGHRVAVDWGGTLDIVKRVSGGEVADIVIIPTARIDAFVKE